MVKAAAIMVSNKTTGCIKLRFIPIFPKTITLCLVAMAEITKGKVKAA